jgi:hypothetical protein
MATAWVKRPCPARAQCHWIIGPAVRMLRTMLASPAHGSVVGGARSLAQRLAAALTRARAPIALVALAHVCPLVLGGVLATVGNSFALDQRDAIVGAAQRSDTIIAYEQNERLKAALLDFEGNAQAAFLTSITGLAVVGPLPIAAYRGWVGGIVSVDALHISRLSQPGPALYYVVTLALQLIPYTLTGGAGMYLGLVAWRRRNDASVRSVLTLRIPGEATRDCGWIWALALPMFLAASLFEFGA